VKSSFHYKLILLKAPQAVAALEKTGIASHFSVDDLFHALSTPSCHVCGQFGTYLWIPECVRCCLACMSKPELLPMTERDARAAFGLTKSGLERVPIMATLPGTYTSFQRPYSRTRYLLSQERARQAAVDIHGGEEELAEYVNNGTSNAKIAYDQRVAKRGGAVNDPTRFMSVVPLPYLDSGLRVTRTGLACQGCHYRTRGKNRHFQTYTKKSIFEHFNKCSSARRLWKAHRKMTGKSSKGTPGPYSHRYLDMLMLHRSM
jgi:hypothetical protein